MEVTCDNYVSQYLPECVLLAYSVDMVKVYKVRLEVTNSKTHYERRHVFIMQALLHF